MKTTSQDLKANLSAEVTSFATCWKITRIDNTILGFTDHTNDISFENINYKASSGFTPTTNIGTSSLAVDNLNVDAIINSDSLSSDDLLSGRYDFADVVVFLVNYSAPTNGRLLLRTGKIGRVTINNGQFVAEVRSIKDLTSQTIGQIYSPTCRADFCDNRCKLNADDFTYSGSVTKAISNKSFEDSNITQDSGYYDFGVIRFTTGPNAGIPIDVETSKDGTITLSLAMPHKISVGEQFSLLAGCDKKFSTCKNRFRNLINFRGEPHIPGVEKLIEIGEA